MKTQNSDFSLISDQFEERERQDAGFLWDQSARLTPEPNHMPSRLETEKALQSVHKRIGRPVSRPASRTRTLIIRVSVAAMLLLAVGIGYLLIPHTVSTPYGTQKMVELPDGTALELNSGTTIRYSKLFGFRNRNLSIDGEAYVMVAPAANPATRKNTSDGDRQEGQLFTIRANNSIVEVTGTSFNIRSRSDDPGLETRVHVTSGSVSLYPAGKPDHRVHLEAGSWSRWNESMVTPMTPEPASIDEIAGWRNNRFTFRNEPLGVILREIERRFDIRIQLEAENAASEILTAHYAEPQHPENIIEDICHVKGLRFAETANGFRIYR